MGIFKGIFGLFIFMTLITNFKEIPSNDAVTISIAIIIAGTIAYSGKE